LIQGYFKDDRVYAAQDIGNGYYGPRMTDPPPRTASDPVNPTDNYTHHKTACEKLLKESSLPWTILRVAVVSITDVLGSIDPIIFEIPLDQRLEFVHSKDVARACVNCITADTVGKTLLIGGGKDSQLIQRDFIKGTMAAAGLSVFPESAFIVPEKASDWFYTDFMDTEEAQELLHFQVYSFNDYLKEFRAAMGPIRFITKALSPVIIFILSLKSPYYKKRLLSRIRG